MFNYNSNNIFAKIIRQEIPVKKVYEDKIILAFYDIKPEAPIHILAITKQAYCNYTHFINQATSQEIAYFLQKVAEIANQQCPKGFRLITNNGSDALQTVEHFHMHILGGEKLGALIGI
jgi:diadenosine tetraphosphate (Ap4A) HIT family hydrolase